ncbi:semaphorin-7A isoform X2 [Xenopus laevis]|uniref:Semaphorin-7A isoform X2 n=1 Tax=Xenopus laevis TaxID=8355 RepID=A0A8J1MMG9_XENLA|nr:semaphorin-7A isoform X2 [Xenopus laevis]
MTLVTCTIENLPCYFYRWEVVFCNIIAATYISVVHITSCMIFPPCSVWCYIQYLLLILNLLCFLHFWYSLQVADWIQTKSLLAFPMKQRYPVFYLYSQDKLYVGGMNVLYFMDFTTMEVNKTVINKEHPRCGDTKNCTIYVTLVGQLEKDLLVCGTVETMPACWKLKENTIQQYTLADEFSPRTPETNNLVLITGNEVYSTNNGKTVKNIFKKIHGKKPFLYTGDDLMKNPHYIKALVVDSEEEVQDKILLFFIEDNENVRSTEKRISMVARMCKNDPGPSKLSAYNRFSTALKSRMICGYPKAKQYFPYLQDVFMLKGKEKNLIYGLFTNAWNHSAVCSYNLLDTEKTFDSSSLWRAPKTNLPISPGTCLQGNRTPEATFDRASEFPELQDWIEPSGKEAVFQNSSHYRKIVVDEVEALDGNSYRVILLATGGTVQKIVEIDDGVVSVLKMNPFNETKEIIYLTLEPKMHLLYVGTNAEVTRLPLDDCTAYNETCEDCVRSRDPYCSWTENGCQSILKQRRGSQNITHGVDTTCSGQSDFKRRKNNSSLTRLVSENATCITRNSTCTCTLILEEMQRSIPCVALKRSVNVGNGCAAHSQQLILIALLFMGHLKLIFLFFGL